MLETLREVRSARRWYSQHGDGQYREASLSTYDHAANALTRRGEFADRALLDHIGPNPGRILEIAAGTGLISARLSRHLPDAVYTELEPLALELLKSRISSGSAREADFYHLPFDSASFDTAVTVGGYRYVDPERKTEFWSELDRVVGPDGRVIVAQFYPRGAHLQGSNIQQDIPHIGGKFQLESMRTFNAKVPLVKGVKVRSGTYRSFAFRHSRA